jgi:hypothetical protein
MPRGFRSFTAKFIPFPLAHLIADRDVFPTDCRIYADTDVLLGRRESMTVGDGGLCGRIIAYDARHDLETPRDHEGVVPSTIYCSTSPPPMDFFP